MTKIALIGGGGFAKEVDEIAELCGHEVVGYFADQKGVLNRPYLGPTSDIQKHQALFEQVCVGFGAVDRRSLGRRSALIEVLIKQGIRFISLVSPHAICSRGVTIGAGTIIAHGVTLSVDCIIGPHSIVNSNAIIGHDASVAKGSIIAPGAFLGGMVQIGENSLIGPGAIVLEGRSVGNNAVVGLGATVVRSVQDGATVMPLRSLVRM